MKMKSSIVAVVALFGTASRASRPHLSIQVRDGSFEGFDAIDPAVSWSGSGQLADGDVGLEFGMESSFRPTRDIAKLPRNIWGKANKAFGAWKTSIRAEVESDDWTNVNFDIDADHNESDLSVKLSATAAKDSVSISSIEATKGFESDGARITINPEYDFDDEEGNVSFGYYLDKTSVELTAWNDAQRVALSKKIGQNNRITPTLESDGSLILEWEKSWSGEENDNLLTTTLKPSEGVNVEWKDREWTANVYVPIVGSGLGRATVNVKREVDF